MLFQVKSVNCKQKTKKNFFEDKQQNYFKVVALKNLKR